MGKLVFACKATHVPSLYLSELPGKNHGCRQAAIDGLHEIARRMMDRGVDTVVIFDTHWLVNSAYHINCGSHFKGTYTSNELPHFIHDMPFEHTGSPVLGQLIAEEARKLGVRAMGHEVNSLELEYATLVPMRYMGQVEGCNFKVVSIAAFLTSHLHSDSRKMGEALLTAIERYDGNVGVIASGSLSHYFIPDHRAEEGLNAFTNEFNRQVDEHVMKLWTEGRFEEFCKMLPEYAVACQGEGAMHDTVMLLGLLGWDQYKEKVDVICPLFPSSGTGQVICEFPIPESIKQRQSA